jgi:hypothetical protein
MHLLSSFINSSSSSNGGGGGGDSSSNGVVAAALLKLNICFDGKRHKNTEMLNSPFDVYRPNLINKWFVNNIQITRIFQTSKQTPWPESASELYRPSDRRLSAKLVPTFSG